jgi:hypothetical protein
MKEEGEEAADPCLKLHHGAFEFATLDELLGSYTMVKALGIGLPSKCERFLYTWSF